MASGLGSQITDETERNLTISSGLTLKEKRVLYTCGSKYVTLDQIPTWKEQYHWIGEKGRIYTILHDKRISLIIMENFNDYSVQVLLLC